MRTCGRFLIIFVVGATLCNTIYCVDFFGEVEGGFSALVANGDAPLYIKETNPFSGDFQLKAGLYFPFSYTFSGEISGGFEYRERQISLESVYLQYFGETFSIIGGKSDLLWGYGWFSHPSYFPDLLLEGNDYQFLAESKTLWNISYTHFFTKSNLNFFILAHGLETSRDNWYSLVLRDDFFFEHLAFGLDLAIIYDKEIFQFHSALDGEFIIDDHWKIAFALDYKYSDEFTYLLGISRNSEKFLFVAEFSGLNRAFYGDVLFQLAPTDSFTTGLLFHGDFDLFNGKIVLMTEHQFSGNMEQGVYINYLYEFDGSIVYFPLVIAYKLKLKI